MAAPLSDSLALLSEVNPDVQAQPQGASPAAATATAAAADSGASAGSDASRPAAAAAAAAAPDRAGYMRMNSYESPEEFTRYWFVLADNVLSYADDEVRHHTHTSDRIGERVEIRLSATSRTISQTGRWRRLQPGCSIQHPDELHGRIHLRLTLIDGRR